MKFFKTAALLTALFTAHTRAELEHLATEAGVDTKGAWEDAVI